MLVIAHRGVVAGSPENTVAAFRSAVALGFAAIELDLRATLDGHLVVMHDETVDRTTDGTGRVNRLTLAEIHALDAGGHHVPTYPEALEAIRGTGVQLVLDIKEDDPVKNAAVVRSTEKHDAAADVIVGVRSAAGLRRFKSLNPGLRTLALVPGRQSLPSEPAVIDEFVTGGADLIRLWPSWITRDRATLLRRLRALGKPVWTTADVQYGDIDPEHPREDLAELIRLGVDGVITDRPELCRAVLAEST